MHNRTQIRQRSCCAIRLFFSRLALLAVLHYGKKPPDDLPTAAERASWPQPCSERQKQWPLPGEAGVDWRGECREAGSDPEARRMRRRSRTPHRRRQRRTRRPFRRSRRGAERRPGRQRLVRSSAAVRMVSVLVLLSVIVMLMTGRGGWPHV
jgi:hypothetical protein